MELNYLSLRETLIIININFISWVKAHMGDCAGSNPA